MTYWPISSPSVFAATKTTNLERVSVSHDGTDQPSQDGRDGASEADSTTDTDDDTSDSEYEGVKGSKPETDAQASGAEQIVEDDVHGEIVAIRVTRSGQLFATLTQTTLTIWQTKVCFSFLTTRRCLPRLSLPSS